MPIEIAQTHDIAACHLVRHAVFIGEQGVSLAEEVDGLDPDALHILASEQGRPIGAARILINGDTAKIGRVCVLVDHRGTGLGAQIIQACLALAATQPGVQTAKLGAQVEAIGFYEKLGFTAYGARYLDARIEHQDMKIAL